MGGLPAAPPSPPRLPPCLTRRPAPPRCPQFIYASLVGNFPFNAFLSAFFCCIGTFVLTLGLRMKLSEGGGGSSSGSQVGEFGGYALAMCTLLLASWNYIG